MSFYCEHSQPFSCLGQCKRCAEKEIDQALLQKRCEQQSVAALAHGLSHGVPVPTQDHLIDVLTSAASKAARVYALLEKIKLTSEDVFTLNGLGQALADLEGALIVCGMREEK